MPFPFTQVLLIMLKTVYEIKFAEDAKHMRQWRAKNTMNDPPGERPGSLPSLPDIEQFFSSLGTSASRVA